MDLFYSRNRRTPARFASLMQNDRLKQTLFSSLENKKKKKKKEKHHSSLDIYFMQILGINMVVVFMAEATEKEAGYRVVQENIILKC